MWCSPIVFFSGIAHTQSHTHMYIRRHRHTIACLQCAYSFCVRVWCGRVMGVTPHYWCHKLQAPVQIQRWHVCGSLSEDGGRAYVLRLLRLQEPLSTASASSRDRTADAILGRDCSPGCWNSDAKTFYFRLLEAHLTANKNIF